MKTLEATVDAVLIGDHPESFITRRLEEVNLEFGGIPGDRHFGMIIASNSRQPMYPKGTEILNRRQISILSVEECSQIAEKLGLEYVLPEWLGANLLLSGYSDLTQLPMGSRILFPNGTGLICMGENQPCVLPGEVIQILHGNQPKLAAQFVRAAYKRRGVVCAVERPGKIQKGDQVKILVNDFSKPMQ
ncbi:MOSC domain-containing protein [Scopulibacillus cellulosilyticus]|uniref:MOSC domain-containing protein n=1 Tax=Scopulibacillus cellulosilyticus TaxID=2665665 RepID=A0ABW2PPY4_9BACL